MFFFVSKAFWFVAKPSSFLLILLVIGAGLLWLGRLRIGCWLTTGATAALVITVLLPVGRWLLLPLENRFVAPAELPDHQVDGIVVLSGAVESDISAARAQPNYNEAAERISALIELGRLYPSARLVFTGGGAPVTAADMAREFYQRQGFNVSRIVFENKARNTFENAILSRHLMQPQRDERWILVTSARHMPRAIGVFRQVDWPVIPYPVDYRTTGRLEILSGFDLPRSLRDLDLGAKEWIGLVAYRLTGRTRALLPG